jgi:hypothetical protein
MPVYPSQGVRGITDLARTLGGWYVYGTIRVPVVMVALSR